MSAQIETSSNSLSSEISTNPLESSIGLGGSLFSLSYTSTSGDTTSFITTSIRPRAAASEPCPAANGTEYCDPGGDPYLIYCDRVFYAYALLVINNASFTECITLCSAYVRAALGAEGSIIRMTLLKSRETPVVLQAMWLDECLITRQLPFKPPFGRSQRILLSSRAPHLRR